MAILRFAFCVFLSATILAVGPVGSGPAHAQPVDDLGALNQQVQVLYQAGKYAEAIPLAERYAERTKARYGASAAQYATAISNLAQLLQTTNRLTEAERLFRSAIVIDEKALGSNHPTLAVRLTTWLDS